MQIRGIYISDVFLGHRNFPHFVIAVRHESEDEEPYVLRATIDTGKLNSLLSATDLHPIGDIFLVNQAGVLQTPSTCSTAGCSPTSLPQPAWRESRRGEQRPTPAAAPLPWWPRPRWRAPPFIWWWPSQPAAFLQKWDLLCASTSS